MSHQWQRIDQSVGVRHINPTQDDCFFFMHYTSRGGWDASEANSRIYNFKAKPNDPNHPKPVEYILQARQQFINDLKYPIGFLLQHHSKVNLTFIPTSRSRRDNLYNDRFEFVCGRLKAIYCDKLAPEELVENVKSRQQSSSSNYRRGEEYVQEIKANFRWLGFKDKQDVLIIVDDVIKTGAQFKALKELITEKTDSLPKIYGLFWALASHN